MSYVIFVILLIPAPFSADTKNTPNPDLLTPKRHNIADFYTKTHQFKYFDTRLEFLIHATQVVNVTNIRYDGWISGWYRAPTVQIIKTISVLA